MCGFAITRGEASAQTPPTSEQIVEGIRYIWPEHLHSYAIRVIHCESTTGTHPLTYADGQIHSGPFQFSNVTWRPYFEGLGISWVDVIFDPYVNAWAAYQIYLRQGPGAWPNC